MTWSFHISELGKSLGRAIGIIYRLKKTGCPPKVLLNLYFALFQSHLSYGLLAWGTASRTSIEKLFLLQKKIVRIISGESYTAHTGPIFKKLEILNLWDLYDHSFAKFMFDFHHNNLPDVFSDYFVRTNEIHNYNTRAHSKGSLHALLKPKNIHGSLLTSNLGVTIYNKIIDLDFFLLALTISCSVKNTKNILFPSTDYYICIFSYPWARSLLFWRLVGWPFFFFFSLFILGGVKSWSLFSILVVFILAFFFSQNFAYLNFLSFCACGSVHD